MRNRPPHLRVAARDGRISSDADHAAEESYVSALAPSPVELLALQILRYSFATHDTDGWEKAHLVAEKALPAGDAAVLVAKSAGLLRAIRRERPGRFGYVSADCPTCSRRISQDEQAIILLIRTARDDVSRLRELTLDFSAGHEASGICASLTDLSATLAMIGNLVERDRPSRETIGTVVLHSTDGGLPC